MMEDEKPKNKGGKPRRCDGKYDPYDPRTIALLERRSQVKALAAMGCSTNACARMVGISRSTLLESYMDAFNEGRDLVAMNVRKWQLEKGQEGCSKMLIYLGAVYCEDQRDLAQDTLSKQSINEGIDYLCQLAQESKENKGEKEDEMADS